MPTKLRYAIKLYGGTGGSPAVYEFTVQGHGPFPLDMLRYDCCWPKRQTDVRSVQSFDLGTRDVVLHGITQPHIDRWASYGWRVLEAI